MTRVVREPAGAAAGYGEDGAAWVDGEIVPVADAKISILDTGFSRSDVTYDVVGVWGGAFFRLDEHLERFEARAAAAPRPRPGPRGDGRILFALVRRSGLRDAYVETLCTRGASRRGVRDPRTFENRFFAYAIPYVWLLRPGTPTRAWTR